MTGLVYALSVGFKIWMAVDAARRGMAYFWFFLIFFLPFGEFIYFFAVKIDDYRMGVGRLFRKRVSLQELEYNARTTPSVQNQLDLAQALFDREQYQRAQELFEEVLANRDDERAALYGAAIAASKRGNDEAAERHLQKLLPLDLVYADFEAAISLANIQWRQDRKSEALALLDRIEKKTTRLKHHVQIAELRLRDKAGDEAGQTRELDRLSRVIDDFDHSPWHVRKGQYGWAKRARRLIKDGRKKLRGRGP